MLRKTIITYALIIVSGVFSITIAQIDLKTFATVGTNPVDNPVFSNVGIYTQTYYKRFYFTYAFDLNLTQREVRPFQAIYSSLVYQWQIKENALLLEVNLLYKPSTELVREFNWGVMAKYNTKKWEFDLGTNFKRFNLNKDFSEELSDNSIDVLKERPGMTYCIKYFLLDRSDDSKNYNVNFMLTNFDWFIIEQETNPFVGAGFYYDFNDTDLSVFSHLFYQAAGFNNIRVNYFGLYFRAGLTWEIEY
jgi:hypothetical protein